MENVQDFNREHMKPLNKRTEGEKIISKLLKEKGIDYWIEYTPKFLERQRKRFDFYIPDKKLFIEYDGYQHFVFPNRYHKIRREWEKYNMSDKIKQSVALRYGYRIARIDCIVKRYKKYWNEHDYVRLKRHISHHLDKVLEYNGREYFSSPYWYYEIGLCFVDMEYIDLYSDDEEEKTESGNKDIDLDAINIDSDEEEDVDCFNKLFSKDENFINVTKQRRKKIIQPGNSAKVVTKTSNKKYTRNLTLIEEKLSKEEKEMIKPRKKIKFIIEKTETKKVNGKDVTTVTKEVKMVDRKSNVDILKEDLEEEAKKYIQPKLIRQWYPYDGFDEIRPKPPRRWWIEFNLYDKILKISGGKLDFV